MFATWDERPAGLRSLFNPAFCSLLIVAAVKEYTSQRRDEGMPLLTAYLLLPIILHKTTRDVLPSTTQTSFSNWIATTPQVHVGLAERIGGLRVIAGEAIRFAVAGEILRLTEAAELRHVPYKPRGLPIAFDASVEVASCFKAARDLGRWFARVPDMPFLFRLLRIQP